MIMQTKFVQRLSDKDLLKIHKGCFDKYAIEIVNREYLEDEKIYKVSIKSKEYEKENTLDFSYTDFGYIKVLGKLSNYRDKTLSIMAFRILMTRIFGSDYAIDLLESELNISRNDILIGDLNKEKPPINTKRKNKNKLMSIVEENES